MDRRLRDIERSGDRRALAHAYARMGQTREGYSIMIACLEYERDGAKALRDEHKKNIREAGEVRFKEAGGCMECLGSGYFHSEGSWRRQECVCKGKGTADRKLLYKTDDERARENHLGNALGMAQKELAAWKPRIERGDLVMYDNERARAVFGRNSKHAGLKVPHYTCGTVTWAQIDARLRIEVITGDYTGVEFYTSVRNVSHVNAWKKIMEKEGVEARLKEYKPQRNDWVWCRGHYGRITRVTYLRGTQTLGVGLRTPGNLFYWFPAHECRRGDPPKTNLLESLMN